MVFRQVSVFWQLNCKLSCERKINKKFVAMVVILKQKPPHSESAKKRLSFCQSRLDFPNVENERILRELEEVKMFNIFISGIEAGERRTVTVNDVEFSFRWAPAGWFMMGSPKGDDVRDDSRDETGEYGRYNSEILHKVTLTKGFWIMETLVTQKQWKAVMGNNPSYFKGDDLPVEKVSWYDCQKFCQKCARLGLPLQLPTEAQWEYACRSGSTSAYFWGNELNGDKANCDGNFPCGTTIKGTYLKMTTPVGSYAPNAWGLYDMHGNVFEWCQDWFGAYSSVSVTDPTGPLEGDFRILRGGCWFDLAAYCRSAYRNSRHPERRDYTMGFRCVKG